MSEQTQAVVKAQSKTVVSPSPQGSVLQHAAVNAEQHLTEESNPPLNGHFEHDFSKVRINHHVPATVQTKLTIGQAGDQFEREADNVADSVMRMSAPGGSAVQTISPVSVGELRRQSDDDQQKNAAASSSAGSSQLIPDTSSSDRDKKLVSVLDTQPGAKPNNYDEAAGKAGEAFMKTDAGKQVVAWASETFLDKPGGKVITGAIAAEALAALYGTHSPLPIQPQIPLDFVKPGLSVKFTYEGPVNKPTKAGITVSFEPKKKEDSLSTKNQKYRSETERMRAEQEKFREGLKTPQQRKEDEEFQRRWLLQHDPLTKGLQQGSGGGAGTTSGSPGTPALGSMQLQMPEYHPDLQNKGFNLPKLHLKDEEDETMQRKESGTTPSATHAQGAPPIVHDVLHSSGQPLDTSTRSFMESRFGHDFSGVRVHTDARAAESAWSVNALAYTVGRNVVFGAGQYTPTTTSGKRLLAHELTHVVQQKGAGISTGKQENITVAPSRTNLEVEANSNTAGISDDRSVLIGSATPNVQLMKQPAGPNPQTPKKTFAQGSSSSVVSTPTRKQIRRDDFLRSLAARPGFALDSWKRLKPDEQTVVVTYMAALYGLDFAKRFRATTLKLPRRDDLIIVTNDPDYTPARLTASGYKLYSSGGVQIWLHPSGKEVWITPSSAGTAQQAPPQEDPAVTEARNYAEDFTSERDHIVDLGKQLRNHIGKPDYPQLYKQFWDDFNKWQNELNEIREKALPDLKGQVGTQDQQTLEQQSKRLDDLFEWKSAGFPDLVRDLPAP